MAGSDQKAGRIPNRSDIDADEDPLIELARIVSEDGGFSSAKKAPQRRAESAPAEAAPVENARIQSAPFEPAEAPSFSDGLEAELLQELESSFAARETPSAAAPPPRPAPQPQRREEPAAPLQSAQPRRPTIQSAPPRPAPRPAPTPSAIDDGHDPDDLLRSIEEQLGAFERRQAERLAATTASFTQGRGSTQPSDADIVSAAFDEAEAEPAAAAREPEPRRSDWQRGVVAHLRPLDDDEPEEAEEEIATAPLEDQRPVAAWDTEPEPEPAPHPEYRFRGPAGAGWDHNVEEEPEELPELPRHEEPETRRPYRAEAFGDDEATDAELFAPAGKARGGREPLKAHSEDVVEDGAAFPAEAFGRGRQSAAFPEFDEPPVAATKPSASRMPESLEQRFSDPTYEANWNPKPKRAPDEPKVAKAKSPPPGKGRHSAAARAKAAKSGGARVMLLTIVGIIAVMAIGGAAALFLRSTERAPSVEPPVIAADPDPVKVAAAGTSADTDASAAGAAVFDKVAGAEPSAPDEQVVENSEEPREVARIVLPPPQSDSGDTLQRPVGEQTQSAEAPADEGSDEFGPRLVPTYTVRPDGTIVANSGDAPAESPPSAAAPTAPQPSPAEPVTAEASALPPAAAQEMTPRSTINDAVEVATVEPPAAAPARSDEPVNLLASANPEPAPPPTASDGFLVQLSSQRSEDQARSTFANLQRRYASVLGNLQPNIQRADLGDRGIYYRLRVGPWASRDDAISVCETLKAAGGDCLVTQ